MDDVVAQICSKLIPKCNLALLRCCVDTSIARSAMLRHLGTGITHCSQGTLKKCLLRAAVFRFRGSQKCSETLVELNAEMDALKGQCNNNDIGLHNIRGPLNNFHGAAGSWSLVGDEELPMIFCNESGENSVPVGAEGSENRRNVGVVSQKDGLGSDQYQNTDDADAGRATECTVAEGIECIEAVFVGYRDAQSATKICAVRKKPWTMIPY